MKRLFLTQLCSQLLGSAADARLCRPHPQGRKAGDLAMRQAATSVCGNSPSRCFRVLPYLIAGETLMVMARRRRDNRVV
jgi:hypothetical protein